MRKIVVQDLTMKARNKVILDNLSIQIDEGDSIAILGPNGAGKTTLVNAILGIQRFKQGKVINDFNALPKYKIGVHMQEGKLNGLMKVKEALDLFLFEGDKGSYSEFVKKYNLEDKLNQKIGTLSGGEKQKLQLIIAFENDPEILFLDEIITGLDAHSRDSIILFLKNQLRQKDKTLVMVTHYFEEVDDLCDKIAVLDKGRLIEFGKKSDLLKKYDIQKTVYIEFNEEIPFLGDLLPNSVLTDNTVEVRINDKKEILKVMDFITSKDTMIKKYIFREPTVEELYDKILGGNANE